MSKKTPRGTNITIGRNGIYDLKNRVYYYDKWMVNAIGKKVYALTDLLKPEDGVLIYDSDTDKFLGNAKVRKTAYTPANIFTDSTAYKPVLANAGAMV